MSDHLAIECIGVTKNYGLGEELALSRTLARLAPWRPTPERTSFTALNAISFEVARGSFFGIVGPNGSGKSTLTQVISGITVPDAGEARVWGRVLPLLEVGAGFHDELTGRENIYLLGAILGLGNKQIKGSIEAILDFSGVERHIDTPLKRYSSGMKARLSFATAICFPADTYVFDEVLSLVDEDFRERCSAELNTLNAVGRTILFMSHDLDLVVQTCSTGMWLEQGTVRYVGSIEDVAAAYRAGSVDATASSSSAA